MRSNGQWAENKLDMHVAWECVSGRQTDNQTEGERERKKSRRDKTGAGGWEEIESVKHRTQYMAAILMNLVSVLYK